MFDTLGDAVGLHASWWIMLTTLLLPAGMLLAFRVRLRRSGELVFVEKSEEIIMEREMTKIEKIASLKRGILVSPHPSTVDASSDALKVAFDVAAAAGTDCSSEDVTNPLADTAGPSHPRTRDFGAKAAAAEKAAANTKATDEAAAAAKAVTDAAAAEQAAKEAAAAT